MSTKVIYKPVSGREQGNDTSSVVYTIDDSGADESGSHHSLGNGSSEFGSGDGIFHDEDDDNDLMIQQLNSASNLQHMEISNSFDDDFTEHLFGFKDPWLPSVLITLCMSTPILGWNAYFFTRLVGALMVTIPFVFHLLVLLWTAKYVVGCRRLADLQSPRTRLATSIITGVDVALYLLLYPQIWNILDNEFFTEIDGATSTDWAQAKRRVAYCSAAAYSVVVSRALLGINAVGLRTAAASMDSSFANTPSFVDRFCTVPSYLMAPFLYLDSRLAPTVLWSMTESTRRRIRNRIDLFLNLLIVVISLLLLLGFRDAYLRFIPRSPPQPSNGVNCDPMDPTECFLPFPSFHMLREDSSTETGFRVNFDGAGLPPLKTGKFMDPAFLNQLDGFSTMGPILFYIDGLKEAHLAGIEQLKGPDSIAESTSTESVTLLINVDEAKLVAHSAEIDFLDADHPMVMLFPAKPLRHNDHYAVAMINAQNRHGKRLPQSKALRQLLHSQKPATSPADPTRRDRYLNVVIPALEHAAPWFDAADSDSLQLLFDFHTVSASSQLGSVRTVRDRTLLHVSSVLWNWADHVRTVAVRDFDNCGLGGDIARTIHAELDVPWFLKTVGSGSRFSVLNGAVVSGKKPPLIGKARFVVHVPCSLKFAALNGSDSELSKPLRTVMDYGHGLFGHRGEANDPYLGSIANKEGYMIIGMDWRGMSAYDLLNVIKTLISAPEQAQALRDNIIQGYASKYALQSFARTTLLSMDWLRFELLDVELPIQKPIPTLNHKTPSFVFYGVSQGGILGAGYTTLSGKTGLIDRAVLTAAGTPFAFIMTRSLDFKKYDQLLLLNYYNNRHVRVAIALVQMAWDSVEASGTLAPPLSEPYPPTLLQAGLGDAIVSTFATESLARAFNATTVPKSPHDVFGLDKMPSTEKPKGTPLASLTELFYNEEYAGLPRENKFAKDNAIHYCVRSDKALVAQLAEFINIGHVGDPCKAGDVCHRSNVTCYSHYD